MAADDFDPYHKWLGIPPGKRPPTHYQLLGLSEKEADRTVIDASAARQAAFVASFRGGEHGRVADRLLYEIGDAKFTLLDPEGRKRYDDSLHAKRKGGPAARAAGSVGLPPRVGGGRTVGEESGLARELGKVLAVIVAGFLVMLAASAVYWNRDRDPARTGALGDLPAAAPPAAKAAAGPARGDVEPPVAVERPPEPATDGGWVALFNGRDLTGWTEAAGWSVENGLLVCEGEKGPSLWTDREFADVELELEFNLSPGANSGVFLRAPRNPTRPGRDCIEIQLIDEARPPFPLKDAQVTAAVHEALPAGRGVVRPAGEWNRMKITATGPRIAVSLNDRSVLDGSLADLPDEAKFRGLRRASGFVGLQNHTGRVEFRGVRVRPIGTAAAGPPRVPPATVAASGNRDRLP